VFYLLGKLEAGDSVIVFFADKKYVYEVTGKKSVSADDTSWLDINDPGSEGSGEELLLQTCDPPGTTWRRLIVVAKPIQS
jgi:LPXTG-site transpeptidase (sortase) family protein